MDEAMNQYERGAVAVNSAKISKSSDKISANSIIERLLKYESLRKFEFEKFVKLAFSCVKMLTL
jgi:hypothetical protein